MMNPAAGRNEAEMIIRPRDTGTSSNLQGTTGKMIATVAAIGLVDEAPAIMDTKAGAPLEVAIVEEEEGAVGPEEEAEEASEVAEAAMDAAAIDHTRCINSKICNPRTLEQLVHCKHLPSRPNKRKTTSDTIIISLNDKLDCTKSFYFKTKLATKYLDPVALLQNNIIQATVDYCSLFV
jgi:hypothetical protein